MIISFSGRKSSGKTTLSNYLVQNGYQKISFATELKSLVAQLYSLNINDLSDPIKKEEVLEKPLIWDKKKANELGNIIGASKPLVSDFKQFESIREALQFIGTEVLRQYDNDFHVKSIKKYIKSDQNYVLDDVRFHNELSLLKEMGAICIYILRPYYFEKYSNHESEIQLNRCDFEYVMLNNKTEISLIRQFKRFYKHLICHDRKKDLSRKKLVGLLKSKSTTQIAHLLKCSRDAVVWWCNRYLIPILRNDYKLDHNAFYDCNIRSAYIAGLLSADGCVKKSNKNAYVLELSNDDEELIAEFRKFLKTDKLPYCRKRDNGKTGFLLTINSPFILDDMKLWNIEPLKSKYNKIPDRLRDSPLFKYWLVGLIDGDGSIFTINDGSSVCINILGSKDIIEYVKNKYRHIDCTLSQEKNIDNLFALKFHGKNAVQLYREIYCGVGLKRKWDKVKPFLKKKWLH